MDKWIDIKTGLPRRRRKVLVYRGDEVSLRPSERLEVSEHLGDGIFLHTCVTNWMYLPDPPVIEEKGS